jgi:hypothetical protein
LLTAAPWQISPELIDDDCVEIDERSSRRVRALLRPIAGAGNQVRGGLRRTQTPLLEATPRLG